MRTMNPTIPAAIAALFLAAVCAHAQEPSPAGRVANAYSASMTRLREASQRLRDAIQSIAQEHAGARRNAAIEQAHAALFDAQQAMMTLPPEMRAGSGDEPSYTRSIERLQQAAKKLSEAVQAMAQQPAGQRRNEAAERTREALLETQQAMIWLPPAMRAAVGGVTQPASTANAR